jgi:hypothetical protein
MRKELPNGRAKRRLASDEWRVVSHLGLGKETVNRGSFARCLPFYRVGEREEANVVPLVGVQTPAACRTGWTTTHIGFPCSGSLTGGPRSGLQMWHEPKSVWAALFIGPAR